MKKYEHLIIPTQIKKTIKYSPKPSGGGSEKLPRRNREEHANYLQNKFDAIKKENSELRGQNAIPLSVRDGTYIEFSGKPNFDLVTKSLENIKSGVRLLNIQKRRTENDEEQYFATVYIPSGEENFFLKKLKEYKLKKRNDRLFRSIEDAKNATLKALWTDDNNDFPTTQNDWYEIWIRISETNNKQEEQHSEFTEILEKLNIDYKRDSILSFPERAVFLVFANKDSLTRLLSYSNQLAEVRSGSQIAGFITKEPKGKQREWLDDLKERTQIDTETNSVISVLDTGVNNEHPLLNSIIPEENCDSVYDNIKADRDGHGTNMCGVVAYGDISSCLASNQKIAIHHQISSIKLYQPNNFGNKDAWGRLTQEAISRTEIIFPNKNICYCMAITAVEECQKDTPTSWSGSIDSIAYNSGATGRLFLISAGNIGDINNSDKEIILNYPKNNSLRPIQNPAQAWNSLTIGAFTNLVAIDSKDLNGFERVAPSGGISPYSRTSSLWKKNSLIKPDVMFEGGNLYKTKQKDIPFSTNEDLELITTCRALQFRYFDTICATSAATALASNFVGKLQARYPNLWAESIRGLIIHSAKWTKTMEEQFPVRPNNRGDMRQRLCHCGYGVPSENKALYSTENSLTYIAQEYIQPFIKEKSNIKMNEMHFFELPWPSEILEELAEENVTMRVTLSYFIEPAPGEIGWKDKYRYASFGLRFDVNNVNESEGAFKSRINNLIKDDENNVKGKNDSNRWQIGSNNRNKGSIHSDTINLTGCELAMCNLIAVYPIGGWWKTRINLNKANKKVRYSLIISLETPKEEINLYTDVKTKIDNIIKTPIDVEIPIKN